MVIYERKTVKTRETAAGGGIKTFGRAASFAAGGVRAPVTRTADAAGDLSDDGVITPEEYASEKARKASGEAARGASRLGAKASGKAREGIAKRLRAPGRGSGAGTAGATARTAGSSVKTVRRTVKTAEYTSKAAVKTAKAAAKTARKSAQTAAKAARVTAELMQKAAAAAYKAAVVISKAAVAAAKGIAAAAKAIAAAIAAGGWVAAVVVIIVCVVGIIAGSVYGIFLSGEDTGSGITMPEAVREINAEYLARLEEAKASAVYDELEMSGSSAVWREVLSVYAVKTVNDPDEPREVATLDDGKLRMLRDVFWEMNDISSYVETVTVTVIIESDDGHGNVVEEETEEERRVLYVTVTHRTAYEMADVYGFSEKERAELAELLDDGNRDVWAAVLYGIRPGHGDLVKVALSQVGNVGGEQYWSWYGFSSRVDWCACFVSWCADRCGYIEDGVIPKYAGCSTGVMWFRERDRWLEGSEEPAAGMIVFFDWDDPDGSAGAQDGVADHTGIVVDVSDGIVHTVEGNSGDAVRRKSYPVGWYEILGYGVPAY